MANNPKKGESGNRPGGMKQSDDEERGQRTQEKGDRTPQDNEREGEGRSGSKSGSGSGGGGKKNNDR